MREREGGKEYRFVDEGDRHEFAWAATMRVMTFRVDSNTVVQIAFN